MVRQQSTGTTLIKVQGNDGSLHDRPSYEIWPSESEYQISFHTNMADNDIEGKRLFPYLKPFLDSET